MLVHILVQGGKKKSTTLLVQLINKDILALQFKVSLSKEIFHHIEGLPLKHD